MNKNKIDKLRKKLENTKGKSKILSSIEKGKILTINGFKIISLGTENVKVKNKNISMYKTLVIDKKDNKKVFVYIDVSKDFEEVKGLYFEPFDLEKSLKFKSIYIKLKDVSGKLFDKLFIISTKYKFKNPKTVIKNLNNISESEDSYKGDNSIKRNNYLRILYMLIPTMTGLFSIILWIHLFKNWYTMSKAESNSKSVLKDMLKNQFKNQDKMYDFFSEYSKLINSMLNLIKSNKLNGLLIYGKPGTGKTFMVLRTLYFEKEKFVIERGGVKNLADLTHILFKYRKGHIIVFDDFDSVLNDPDSINIMKSATDMYPKRVISTPQAMQSSSSEIMIKDVPEKFVFESKIIIITNKERKDISKALLSRMLGVEIVFSDSEILKMINKYIDTISPDVSKEDKLECLLYMKELHSKYKIRLDFRVFNTLLSLKSLYGDKWKGVAKTIYSSNS